MCRIARRLLQLSARHVRDASDSVEPQIAVARANDAGHSSEWLPRATDRCEPLAVEPGKAELAADPELPALGEHRQNIAHVEAVLRIEHLHCAAADARDPILGV